MAYPDLYNLASSFLCGLVTTLPATPLLLWGDLCQGFSLLRCIFLFCWQTCVCRNSVLSFSYASERPSLTTQSEVALSTNHITLAYFILFYIT